jgi:hypothetical protein
MVLEGGIEARPKSLIAEVCEERGAEIIEMEVMPDHGQLRSSGWDRPSRAVDQGPIVACAQAGVSCSALAPADAVDQLVLGLDGGGRAAGRHQAVYREPKERVMAHTKMPSFVAGFPLQTTAVPAFDVNRFAGRHGKRLGAPAKAHICNSRSVAEQPFAVSRDGVVFGDGLVG